MGEALRCVGLRLWKEQSVNRTAFCVWTLGKSGKFRTLKVNEGGVSCQRNGHHQRSEALVIGSCGAVCYPRISLLWRLLDEKFLNTTPPTTTGTPSVIGKEKELKAIGDSCRFRTKFSAKNWIFFSRCSGLRKKDQTQWITVPPLAQLLSFTHPFNELTTQAFSSVQLHTHIAVLLTYICVLCRPELDPKGSFNYIRRRVYRIITRQNKSRGGFPSSHNSRPIVGRPFNHVLPGDLNGVERARAGSRVTRCWGRATDRGRAFPVGLDWAECVCRARQSERLLHYTLSTTSAVVAAELNKSLYAAFSTRFAIVWSLWGEQQLYIRRTNKQTNVPPPLSIPRLSVAQFNRLTPIQL